jgi:hypothetical protein
VPGGRSRLSLELPAVTLPVLDHRWKLLLPETARYRFHGGDLEPAPMVAAWKGSATLVTKRELEAIPVARDPWVILQELPGVSADRINVGGNEDAQFSRFGPGGSASILGLVSDSEGSPLPGVTITITGASNGPLIQVTDAQGLFRVDALPPGSYSAKAELEGFSTIDYPNVQLQGNQSTRLEMAMSAAVEDVITVTAESPMLDERKLSRGETISLGDAPGYYDFDAYQETRSRRRQAASAQAQAAYAAEALELQRGLVGGVKPLEVAIPETGKSLLLTGVLPPARVAVELEVKSKARR